MEGEDWDFVQLTDHNDQRRNRFELQLFNELMPKVRDDRATPFLLFSVRAADLALLFLNPVHEFQFSLPPRNHRLPKISDAWGAGEGELSPTVVGVSFPPYPRQPKDPLYAHLHPPSRPRGNPVQCLQRHDHRSRGESSSFGPGTKTLQEVRSSLASRGGVGRRRQTRSPV